MALSKSVNTITLLSSAVAGIIGSGWLLSPLICARMAGPAAIIAWIIGSFLMLVVASTFVILTRTIPITGGTVRYFQLTHGHFAGFAFSWVAWLAWIAITPIEMMAILQYSSNYISGLMTPGATPELTHLGILTAIAGIIIIGLINGAGMKVYRRINYFILAIKLIIPITAAILLCSTRFHVANFTIDGFMPFGIKSVFKTLPLAGVIYSFVGFNPVVQLAAEAKDPGRGIPVAIFGALLICMLIYILVQTAFIAALPSGALRHGFAHISFVGDSGPYAGLLTLLGLSLFVKALYFDACISPFSTALVQSVATARITYAMSENGYLPASLMKTNKIGTPIFALVFNLAIGLLFFLPFPSWQHLVGFLVSCVVIGYVVGPMSLMALVTKKPNIFKPFPKTVIHVLAMTAFYICNLMIFWSGWSVVYKIMILFLIGYLVLFIAILTNKQSAIKNSLHIARGLWVLLYLAGLAFISYIGDFGGLNKISFGADFIVIALFSSIIYVIAYLQNLTTKQLDL